MKTNDDFIEEDWEREHLLDSMYMFEEERRMIEEWWQWECEQKAKKPAIVKVRLTKDKPKEINKI